MSIKFDPKIQKCFAPCERSMQGEWCDCQPEPVITIDQTPKERFKDVAEAFKQQMIKENDNNSHKGNILEWDNIEDMIVDLEYHKAKLMIAMRQKRETDVKEYLADCANILLAIGNAWELY